LKKRIISRFQILSNASQSFTRSPSHNERGWNAQRECNACVTLLSLIGQTRSHLNVIKTTRLVPVLKQIPDSVRQL